jgi:hypothetical protein
MARGHVAVRGRVIESEGALRISFADKVVAGFNDVVREAPYMEEGGYVGSM